MLSLRIVVAPLSSTRVTPASSWRRSMSSRACSGRVRTTATFDFFIVAPPFASARLAKSLRLRLASGLAFLASAHGSWTKCRRLAAGLPGGNNARGELLGADADARGAEPNDRARG